MKRTLALVLAIMALAGCLLAPMGASAETISGKTSGKVTVKVDSNRKNSYFVISSCTGLARVAQHNLFGKYKKDGNEVTHGFYKVSVKGPGLNNSFIWAPDATTNKSKVTRCCEVRIKLPQKGQYTVTVAPLSNSAAKQYWRVDYIKSWVKHATWVLTITDGCTARK